MKSKFPFWLLCLLLFSALITICIAVFLPFLQNLHQAASVARSEIVTPYPVISEAIPTSEPAISPVPAISSPAVIVSAEPSPTPVATPEPIHIHHYVDGVCDSCGKAPEFYTDFLPREFYQETEKAGSVIRHEYTITAYANHGDGEYDRCFNLYIPYDYNENLPYDVLVLVHGGGGNEDSWLNEVYDYGDIQMQGRVIFDNMFANGICNPCIIVCPVTETYYMQGLTAGINQLRDELREYILPWVAENYSTYAKDGSLESLRAARDHFALGGLSNGALFVFEGGMRYNFDLFGSYAAFSGDGEPWITVRIIQTGDYADLPINCLFTGAGLDGDFQDQYTQIGYDYFLENEPRLTDGKNAFHVDVNGGHEWKVWFTDIFNALPLLFK